MLYGRTIPVDLTASLPAGEPKGYNLAFRAVLPAGTSYVAGSAGNDGEPTVLTNAPDQREDHADLAERRRPGRQLRPHAELPGPLQQHRAPPARRSYDVGDLLPIDTGAYISTDPRDETDFSAAGLPLARSPTPTPARPSSRPTPRLTAIEIDKAEPHPEGEIPRGVHDHQTVYTLTVTNNEVNPTNACLGRGLRPGRPGVPRLRGHHRPHHGRADQHRQHAGVPGLRARSSSPTRPPPRTASCPDLVETVNLDPDGSGPLPSGDLHPRASGTASASFAASQVKQLTYAAAIPIRENTLTWSRRARPATTGAQTANLDNNSGPETYDEQPLLNGAIAAGTYQAPSKPGLAVSDEGTLLRTAEDIAIQKSQQQGEPRAGRPDEVDGRPPGLGVPLRRPTSSSTTSCPNGLCPLGTTNLARAPNGQDAECARWPARSPSSPYTTVAGAGERHLRHRLGQEHLPVAGEDPAERHPPADVLDPHPRELPDELRQLDARAVPRLRAQRHRHHGLDWVRCAPPAAATAPDPSAKIDHDETDGVADTDVSGSGKAATGPIILKRSRTTTRRSGDCNDLARRPTARTVPEYGPGDQVCWKLRLDFPANLDTSSQDVFDILPAGIDYVPGSWQATGAQHRADRRLRHERGRSAAAGRSAAGGEDVDSGGQVFEVTIKTTVGSPLGHHSGDVEGNLQKFSFQNTPEQAFTLRDRVDFKVKLPELALVKGVRQVNAGGVNGPNVDNVAVEGADVVQYRIDVTNNGKADAKDARVWDVLPTGITCADGHQHLGRRRVQRRPEADRVAGRRHREGRDQDARPTRSPSRSASAPTRASSTAPASSS